MNEETDTQTTTDQPQGLATTPCSPCVRGRFRKRPVVVDAAEWRMNGDHPNDDCDIFQRPTGPNGEMMDYPGEGKVVRYYRTPAADGLEECKHCGRVMHVHGWIDTLEGGHIVCPGDIIITGVHGEHYPCKPDIFWKTYEPENAPPSEANVPALAQSGGEKSPTKESNS